MTFSPLTNGTAPHHNKYASRGGRGITRIIVHHWAGTNGGDSRLTNPDQEVSANYILYSDGRLVGQVPEEYRAWTSGSWDVDSNAITVETQNTGVGGDWPVSDAAINTLTNLMVDLANRYGWGSISFGSSVIGHRDVYATACPGPYLYSRLPQIAANANAIRGGGAPAPAAGGSVSGDVDSLARAVIRGDYGNGPARQAALGSRYAEVQARVNQILSGGGSAPAPAPAPAAPSVNGDVESLARAVIRGDYGNGPARQAALGARYNEVQNRVNQILGMGSAPAAPAAVDIEGLAQAVIRGEYGNGADRQARLGANYAAVQNRVNQILAGQAPAAAPAVDIEGLAQAVIRGEYGNGQARRDALGSNYDAVQARVNQILGM